MCFCTRNILHQYSEWQVLMKSSLAIYILCYWHVQSRAMNILADCLQNIEFEKASYLNCNPAHSAKVPLIKLLKDQCWDFYMII